MYKKKDIYQYQNKYIKIAKKEYSKGHVEEALDSLYHACALEHLFNFRLKDEEIENLLQTIAKESFETIKYSEEECLLFYDSVAMTNSALSMQYLRVLNDLDCKIVYLVKTMSPDKQSKGLIDYANEQGFIVEVVSNDSRNIKGINFIRNIIQKYQPNNIFLHMSNDDVYGCIAFSNIESATKFYINHGDEQFWVGTWLFDYILEFRGMGLDASIRHRGISQEKCIVNPYYPIVKDVDFQGFDFEVPDGKTTIFSGGRFLKVYSESAKFMDVIREILITHANAFFVFAGSGDEKPMLEYIHKYSLEDRWKVIGYRSDLLEVMKHVDIYLGTYPQSGALMSQYAAAAGTPLVEMNTNNGGVTEDLLPRLKDWKITVDDWPAYFEQVRRLVNDAEYRRTFSAAIKESLISEEDFSENLKKILETNTSSVPYVRRETNIELRSSRLLEAENSYLHRVPGIMSNKMILKNYPFTGIYNILQFYRYKNKRS